MNERGGLWARRRWVVLQGAVVMAAGMLAGCPAPEKPAATMPAAVSLDAPVVGEAPTAGGIFVPLDSHAVLTGAALGKAMMGRAAIFAAVKSSPALTVPASQAGSRSAATQAATGPAATEAGDGRDIVLPPPLAVKYYLEGREHFLVGENSEAMDYLDKALALDPNAFTVLRLMGRVCFAASQLARGALFLQRAHAIDPGDVEVNYLLGRYWLERRENERAVSLLMQADDSPERLMSSAETPLVMFYLAQAFQAAGYHRAAGAEFEKFLETIELPVAGYRYDRELNYLMEESWAAHLSAGENEALVGDFKRALGHYEIAAKHDPDDAYVISRLVNAQMHLGDEAGARRTAMGLVRETKGSEAAIQLLVWVYKATGRAGQMLADLRSQMHGSGESAMVTVAAAQDYLGDKGAAFETVRDFVAAHPDDFDALGRLLKRVDSEGTLKEAVGATAALLRKLPGEDEEIEKLFAPVARGDVAGRWVRGQGATAPATGGPFEAYLWGLVYAGQNNPALAEASFRAAAKETSFFPAREALVSTLTAEEKYKEASAMIEEAIAHSQGGAKAYELLIGSEAAQDRLVSALKIGEEARKKFPQSAEIGVQLATLHRLRGEDDAADTELMAVIDAHPKFEPAYRRLITSLLNRAGEARAEGGDGEKLQLKGMVYLTRLLREVPGSRYGRITAAVLNARDNLEESEGMLQRLVAEEPGDIEALIPLAEIRQAMGEPTEAAGTLETALKNHPTAELTQALADLYRRDQDKPGDALALTERMMKEHPDDEDYVIVDAGELAAEKKLPEELAVLQAGAEKFPKSQQLAEAVAQAQVDLDKAADAVATMRSFIARNGESAERLYTLSHFEARAGMEKENEATLERILEIDPEHAGANNDLGYSWADAGKNLVRAERMIKKALENRPNDSAFVDSLAWVYYKEGKFAEAITESKRAVGLPGGLEPEVVQHLGDALYRDGQKDAAVEQWMQAAQLLEDSVKVSEETGAGPGKGLSKDDQKLEKYLEGVLRAVKAGKEPAVSPLGVGVKAGERARGPAI